MRSWTTKVKPRRWQLEALAIWQEQLRGIVSVVTGGGKTLFAELCVSAFFNRYPEGRVLVVVPTIALLDQWVVSLWEDLGVTRGDIACYSSQEKSEEPKPLNVLVLNTARSQAERISLTAPSMLIVDECHRSGSTENSRALRGSYCATLGLSATPERDYDDGFHRYIEPALGPVIYEYDYVKAAADGVISPFVLHNVRVQMLQDEEKRFSRLSRRIAVERKRIAKGTGSEQQLTTLLHRRAAVLATATMRIPAAIKIAEQHPNQRIIIFHERVDAANRILTVLRERNKSATIYHAGITPGLRRDNLRLYRRGVYDALVCCRALDEGMNVPDTAVAIIASSTASLRQRVQRLGRVLRPAPGKSLAHIYTIYASDLEEERLALEARRLQTACEVSWMSVGL